MGSATPSVFKGTFKNRDLFIQAFHNWNKANNITKAVYKTVAEASGLTMDVIHRLVNGTKDSREGGYELQPSPGVARILEDFYGVSRGVWGGVDPVPGTPLTGLDESAPEVAVPEPAPRSTKTHTVLGVTGADLDDPPQHEAVLTGFYLLPLDRLGEWGKAVTSLLHPYLQEKARGNKIPIMVEQSPNSGTMVLTAPLPVGDHKTTTLGGSLADALLKGCAKLSGQDAVYAITELFTGLAACQKQEVEAKTLAKATMRDQVAQLRHYIGDFQELVAGMAPLETALRDLDHDVAVLVGGDHPTAEGMKAALERYNALRQNFRSLVRVIQADPLVLKK